MRPHLTPFPHPTIPYHGPYHTIAGIHHDDHYQVTHLLIPEQTSASDRWEVQDERQITNFFVYHPELLMLGLIHTHPKMTSFLSSVDLHALYDYARANKSLIYIVLAPEKKTSPDVGFQDKEIIYSL